MEEGRVYTIKLNSGEELVAKFIGNRQGGYVAVDNPVSIAPGPQGMGLVPSLFTADPALEVSINTNSIAMYVETDDSVRMKYTEATTGIKLPEKKILVG
jgi:hypothetical protein